MRQRAVWFAAILLCVVVTGCTTTAGHSVMPKTRPSLIPRPLVERELAGLLLDANQVSEAMGAPMAITNTGTAMSDNSATMTPRQCLAIDGAAEAAVYASSGFRAERDQSFTDGDHFTHYLKQAVVLYSSTKRRPSSTSRHGCGEAATSTPMTRATRDGPSDRSPSRTEC
jgi:hypothetical protein